MSFYYRPGLSADDLELCRPLVARILARERHGLHLEKCYSKTKFPIYSARVNDRVRVLFSLHERRPFVLEILYDHEYDRSVVLNHTGIDKTPVLFEEVAEIDDLLLSDETEHKERPLFLTEGQRIEFSDEQNGTSYLHLPLLVEGQAGSGKSCVALKMLFDHAIKLMASAEGLLPQLVYVTRSMRLRDAMRRNWHDLTFGQAAFEVVQFKTYDELLLSRLDPDAKLIGFADFCSWYPSFLKKHNQRQKQNKKPQETLLPDKVWRELRIRSGYTCDEDYLALGLRQSELLPDSPSRAFICKVYRDYLKQYAGSVNVISELQAVSFGAPVSFLVVDEAQDFSYAQLSVLLRWAHSVERGECAIALFSGSNQVLDAVRLPKLFLRYDLSLLGHTLTKTKLSALYRCSPAVLQVMTRLILMKNYVAGAAHKGDPCRVPSGGDVAVKEGRAVWMTGTPRERGLLCDTVASSSCVIITWPEYVKEAEEKFDAALVLTPEEAKGLQFRDVVWYRMLDHSDCKAISTRLLDFDASLVSDARAKPGRSDDAVRPCWDRMITGVTRATRDVYFVQPGDTHAVSLMATELKKVCVEMVLADEAVALGAGCASASDQRMNWSKRIGTLEDAGLREKAATVSKKMMAKYAGDYRTHLLSFHENPASLTTALRDDVLFKRWLCHELSSDGKSVGVDKTLLYYLLSHASGIAVLHGLMTQCPEVLRGIPDEIWLCQVAFDLDNPDSEITPLFLLVKRIDEESKKTVADGSLGSDIFSALVMKASVLKNSARAWGFSRAIDEKQPERRTSVLSWLLSNRIGSILFCDLMQHFPHIMNKITTEEWRAPILLPWYRTDACSEEMAYTGFCSVGLLLLALHRSGIRERFRAIAPRLGDTFKKALRGALHEKILIRNEEFDIISTYNALLLGREDDVALFDLLIRSDKENHALKTARRGGHPQFFPLASAGQPDGGVAVVSNRCVL